MRPPPTFFNTADLDAFDARTAALEEPRPHPTEPQLARLWATDATPLVYLLEKTAVRLPRNRIWPAPNIFFVGEDQIDHTPTNGMFGDIARVCDLRERSNVTTAGAIDNLTPVSVISLRELWEQSHQGAVR